MSISTTPFSINNRSYAPPARPVVVICIDGSADEYLDTTLAHRRMPNLEKMGLSGYRGINGGKNTIAAVSIDTLRSIIIYTLLILFEPFVRLVNKRAGVFSFQFASVAPLQPGPRDRRHPWCTFDDGQLFNIYITNFKQNTCVVG